MEVTVSRVGGGGLQGGGVCKGGGVEFMAIHGRSVACCRSPKDLGFTLTCIDADGAMHMFPIRIDKLAAAGFAAGCFPRLGAGLGAVGATSFLGTHFSSSMSQKVWPNLQVPQLQWHHVCTRWFCTTAVGRRALHNSQHRLLCGTDVAHNSALREHFQRSEECNGSEQRSCT